MDKKFIQIKQMVAVTRDNATYYEPVKIIINLDHVVSLKPANMQGYYDVLLSTDKYITVDFSIINHFPKLGEENLEEVF
jgi:cephalosporin hydroxylase